MVESYYNLKFNTYEDKIATIRVPKAVVTDEATVAAAMSTILGSGIIALSAGILKSVDSAELVTTTITDCEITL